MKKISVELICILLLCVGFGSICKAFGQSISTNRNLVLTCSVDDDQTSLSPNAPIWLNVKVANQSMNPFTGFSSGLNNGGALATTSPVTPTLIEQCITQSRMDAPWIGFTTAPKESKTFHILLNNLLPAVQSGRVLGSIILPLTDGDNKSFVLVAPFDITIGPVLTPDQMLVEIDQVVKGLEGSGNGYPSVQKAEASIRALPDEDAVQVVKRVVKDKGCVFEVIESLDRRPRTAAITRELRNLAQSPNSDVSAQAKGYLAEKHSQ